MNGDSELVAIARVEQFMNDFAKRFEDHENREQRWHDESCKAREVMLERLDTMAGKPCQDLSSGEVTHLKVAVWFWKGLLGLGGVVFGFVGGKALWEIIRRHS
jgi:hypothetical protein